LSENKPYWKRWQESHREQLRQYHREWCKKNKDKVRQYAKKYQEIHGFLPQRKYYYKIKSQIFEILGNKCSRCGFSDLRVLQIDHKFGKGNEDRKYKNASYKYYRLILEKLKANSQDYQLLCANCNIIKKFEECELNQWNYRGKKDAIFLHL